MLSYYLDELPHEIIEARSAGEAKALYRRTPGALIIFDDDMPEESIAEAVASIRIFEGEHNFPLASILALAGSDEQIDALLRRRLRSDTPDRDELRRASDYLYRRGFGRDEIRAAIARYQDNFEEY